MQSYDHATLFTKKDRDLLSIAANQIAMAIYKKKMDEKLLFSSTHDDMTGLYNRDYFEEEVSRLSAGTNEPAGVIITDLDNLKYTNDHFGHAAGDRLIISTANIIRNSFRTNDLLSRIGGDEFVVLIPDCDQTVLAQAIERIVNSIAAHNLKRKNDDPPVSLFIGGSLTSPHRNLVATIQIADEKMYAAKAIQKANPSETTGIISSL